MASNASIDADHARAQRDLLLGQAVRVAGAVPALVRGAHQPRRPGPSAGAAETIRSPISVWRRMNSHSCGSSGPGLVEDRVRDRDLADVVQLGGVAHALRLVARSCPGGARSPRRDRATPSRWPNRSGSRSVRARTSTSLLWRVADVRPAFFCAYMRWSAIRSASVGVLRLAREHDRAVRGGDVEALAVLGQRRRRARDDRVGDLVARLEQRAELVAAHPERPPAPAQIGRQVRAQPHQQRVAGRVAEGVVVVLEAVEVEEHEHDRPRVVGVGQQARRARAPARAGCRARSARR